VHWPPINLDSICSRVNLSAEFGHDLPIYPYPPLFDKLLHLAARADTTFGEKFLKTHL
jgi:hypothetical protein